MSVEKDLVRLLALSPLFAVLVALCRPFCAAPLSACASASATEAPSLRSQGVEVQAMGIAASNGVQLELVKLIECVTAVVLADRTALFKRRRSDSTPRSPDAPLSLADLRMICVVFILVLVLTKFDQFMSSRVLAYIRLVIGLLLIAIT